MEQTTVTGQEIIDAARGLGTDKRLIFAALYSGPNGLNLIVKAVEREHGPNRLIHEVLRKRPNSKHFDQEDFQ